MQPSFDLRIRSMLKALTETVAPAVDADNKTAVEQLNIVIASLALLKDQVDYVQWFEFVETRDMLALAERIGGLVGTSAQSLVSEARNAAALANRRDASLTSTQQGNARLRASLARLIELADDHADASVAATVRRAALDASTTQIGRERAFVAGTGFDVFPDNLVSIEASLLASSHS